MVMIIIFFSLQDSFIFLSNCILFRFFLKIFNWRIIALQNFVLFCHTSTEISHSSVQSFSHVWLFATPWTAARHASLSITNSQSSPKLMYIELVMPSNHLILCHPLLLLLPIPPCISLFQWVNSSHQVARVLEFQLQHQSFQRTPRTDLL